MKHQCIKKYKTEIILYLPDTTKEHLKRTMEGFNTLLKEGKYSELYTEVRVALQYLTVK